MFRQSSIFDEIKEEDKKIYLDIFAISFFDKKRKKLRLTTLDWHSNPKNVTISCKKDFLDKYPEGTIFKLDTKIVRPVNHRARYFIPRFSREIIVAIEFFHHNASLLNKKK